MADRALDLKHRALADRHIAEGGARVARQEALLDRLRAASRDTGEAEELLATLESTLTAMRKHRELILDDLGEEPAAPPRKPRGPA